MLLNSSGHTSVPLTRLYNVGALYRELAPLVQKESGFSWFTAAKVKRVRFFVFPRIVLLTYLVSRQLRVPSSSPTCQICCLISQIRIRPRHVQQLSENYSLWWCTTTWTWPLSTCSVAVTVCMLQQPSLRHRASLPLAPAAYDRRLWPLLRCIFQLYGPQHSIAARHLHALAISANLVR